MEFASIWRYKAIAFGELFNIDCNLPFGTLLANYWESFICRFQSKVKKETSQRIEVAYTIARDIEIHWNWLNLPKLDAENLFHDSCWLKIIIDAATASSLKYFHFHLLSSSSNSKELSSGHHLLSPCRVHWLWSIRDYFAEDGTLLSVVHTGLWIAAGALELGQLCWYLNLWDEFAVLERIAFSCNGKRKQLCKILSWWITYPFNIGGTGGNFAAEGYWSCNRSHHFDYC